MENIFATHRMDRAAESRRLETKEAIKDAIGAFAIIAMLYVGLFIPSLYRIARDLSSAQWQGYLWVSIPSSTLLFL